MSAVATTSKCNKYRTANLPCHSGGVLSESYKILTELSKTPLRAVALASFLGDGFAALGSRTPSVKDLMAFGSVLHNNQHSIGEYEEFINICDMKACLVYYI